MIFEESGTQVGTFQAAPDMRHVREQFGERLQQQVSLARYTAARVGGPADWVLVADSADDLAMIATRLWEMEVPFIVLGGGSNVLISDAGVRGLVVLNRSKKVRFEAHAQPPYVWAESGANFGSLARQAATRGLSGLEWAGGIPGTLGGAVVGNAGAHGGDMSHSLMLAEILHHTGHGFSEIETKASGNPGKGTGLLQPNLNIVRQVWTAERFEYSYRESKLKRERGGAVVLSAQLKLAPSQPEAVRETMDGFNELRRRTQPPGASMGSMFKNPPGDYAGRLIEAAGLKGSAIGNAEISTKHANFFVNRGKARAADIYRLIELARRMVAERFGVRLELEIELLGEF